MAAKKKAPARKRGNRSAIAKTVAGKQQGLRAAAREKAPQALRVKGRGAQLGIKPRKGGARKLTGGGAVTRGMSVNRSARRASGKTSGGG
jgi:hypothetical protein